MLQFEETGAGAANARLATVTAGDVAPAAMRGDAGDAEALRRVNVADKRIINGQTDVN